MRTLFTTVILATTFILITNTQIQARTQQVTWQTQNLPQLVNDNSITEINFQSVPFLETEHLTIQNRTQPLILNFNDNRALFTIDATDANLTVNDGIFWGGTHFDSRPWILSKGKLTINNSTFETNPQTPVIFKGTQLNINHTTFENNITWNNQRGGALNIESGEVQIRDSQFLNNWSSRGGAINIQGDTTFFIYNSTFRHNHSHTGTEFDQAGRGGAIYIERTTTSGSIINSTFEFNSSERTQPSVTPDTAHLLGNVFRQNFENPHLRWVS